MERDIQFKFSIVIGNMTWDDMGRKNVMRAIDYEINQYIDFGLKYFLHSNWSKGRFMLTFDTEYSSSYIFLRRQKIYGHI